MRPHNDVLRQISVLVVAIVAIVAATIGSGAFGGTPIAEAADGALSASSTPVAPDGPAFAIWSLIYLGLLVAAVWQVLPAQRTNPRLRSTGWLMAASLVGNAAWIFVVQAGWLAVSVVVIVALLVVLVVILERLLASPPASRWEALVLDGTFGIYLGWVTIATIANITAALDAADIGELGLGATGWSLVLLAAAAVIGVAFAVHTRGRFSVNLALGWGLAWVAVARWQGPLENSTVAVAAAVAAVITIVAPAVVRLPRR